MLLAWSKQGPNDLKCLAEASRMPSSSALENSSFLGSRPHEHGPRPGSQILFSEKRRAIRDHQDPVQRCVLQELSWVVKAQETDAGPL